MQTDHRPLKLISLLAGALDACPAAIANSKDIDPALIDEILIFGNPEVFISYQAYGSTAGPRGGIGGQAVTEFAQIVLVFRDYAVAYVQTGGVEGVYRLTQSLDEDIRNLVRINPREYKPEEWPW